MLHPILGRHVDLYSLTWQMMYMYTIPKNHAINLIIVIYLLWYEVIQATLNRAPLTMPYVLIDFMLVRCLHAICVPLLKGCSLSPLGTIMAAPHSTHVLLSRVLISQETCHMTSSQSEPFKRTV